MAISLKAGSIAVDIIGNDKNFQQKLNQVQNKIKSFGSSLQSLLISTAAFRAAFSGFSAPLQVFAEFEAGVSKVKAIAGATSEQIAALREQAKQLGKTTFFTASQVSAAQKFLAMAGFNTEQIFSATPQVLDLALAGDMDLGMAADIATNISTPFKIAAKDLAFVNDILAKVSTSSNTNVMELGEAFKYVAPAASAAGQTIQELGAAMAILANNGIKADMAGTSTRMMLIKLADAGIQAKLKEQFDVDVTDLTGKMRPLLSILQDLKTATNGLGQTDQMSVFYDIFEQRAGTAALVLGNAGDAVMDFRMKMNDASGSAAAMATTMADHMKGDFIALTSAVEGVQIAFGSAMNETSRFVVQNLTEATRAIAEFITKNQDLVRNLTLLGGGFAVFKAAPPIFTLFRSAMSAVIPIAVATSAAEQTAAAATTQATAAITAETQAILANIAAKRAAVIAEAKRAKASIAAQLKMTGNNMLNLTNSRNDLTANLTSVVAGKNALSEGVATANVQREINKLKTMEIALNEQLVATNTQLTAAESKRAALTRASAAVSVTTTNRLNALELQRIATTTAASAATTRVTLATKLSALSMAGLSKAASLTTAAFHALKVSLLTNPMMWIAGAVAALGGLVYWLTIAREKQAELNDEMAKKREIGDQERSTDEKKFQRLQQLAAQQKLSNAETREAESLTQQLEGRYEDFGAVVDRVAGKLRLAADSMTMFMDAMNAKALQDLENELKEGEKNFQELQEQSESTGWYWRSVFANITFGSVDTGADVRKRIGEQQAEQIQKNNELRKKIARLQNGESALDVAKSDDALLDERLATGTQTETEDARKNLSEILQRMIRERRGTLENEIDDLKERNEEYKKYLQLLLQTEKAKLPEERDTALIERFSDLLERADEDFETDLERLTIKHKIETDIPDFEKMFAARQQLDVSLELGDQTEIQNAREELEKLKKEYEETSYKNIRESVNTAMNELIQARTDYEDAQAEGTKEEIAVAAQKFSEAAQHAQRLNEAYETMSEKRYQDQIQNAAGNEISQVGTFSSAAAMMIGGGYQSKMLNLTEKIAGNTDPKNRKAAESSNKTTSIGIGNEQDRKMTSLMQEQTQLLRDLRDKAKSGMTFV
jgi:TP901 family phage tail tape measure protein